jgi:hypothetical protein
MDSLASMTMVVRDQLIAELEDSTASCRQIALLRIRLLEENDGLGFAAVFLPLLQDSIDRFLLSFAAGGNNKKKNAPGKRASRSETTIVILVLRRLLRIHLKCKCLDPALGEELSRQGTHIHLLKLISYDVWGHQDHCDEGEDEFVDEQDAIIELQDLSCEIVAHNFPLALYPLSRDELRQRLPLVFCIDPISLESSASLLSSWHEPFGKQSTSYIEPKAETILIHQVTTRQSSQHDVGFGECRKACRAESSTGVIRADSL